MNNNNILHVEIADQIAVVSFNRPESYNALNLELAEAFRDACQRLSVDPLVRVVLLKGVGRAFMAGGDLKSMLEAPVESINALIPPVHEAVELLANMPKPVVAAVHGAVAGAGLSIALAADFVLASADTRFSFAYSDIAGSGDAGISWSLPHLAGLRRALHIAMLGEPFSAAEALAWGLLNEVVPAGELDECGKSLAARLVGRNGYALAQIKRLMRSSFDNSLAQQLQNEHKAFADCAAQPAFVEAIGGFFAKRVNK